MSAIVGRASEIDRIRRLVDGDGPAALAIVGEPGIGKSTLLEIACARAAQAGSAVRRADADEIAMAQPFGFLGTLLGDAWHPGQADLQPLALVDTVMSALEVAARDGHLLLALDNLQWADPGSVRVLTSVLRRAVPQGWKVVAAVRPAPVTESLSRLLDAVVEVGGSEIALSPMSPQEVTALARDRLGAIPATSLVRAVEQAGGNPFYVTTLLREFELHEQLERHDGTVALQAGAATPTLNRMLVRRARELGEDAFELLQCAAVLGRSMSLTDLAALRGAPVDAITGAVRAATDAQLLRSDGGDVSFRHDLVMAALRDSTPTAVRRTLHARALELLRASAARPDRWAPHLFELGVDVLDAAELRTVARACSPDVGLRLIERATGHIDDADLLLAVTLPELLLWSGQPQQAVDCADALVTEYGDDMRIEPARAVLSHALFLMGQARTFTAAAADDLDPRVTSMTPARYKAEMSLAVLFGGDAARARRLADDAMRLNAAAPAADSDVTEAVARGVRGFVDAVQGRMTDGLTDLRTVSALVAEGRPEVGFAGPELFHAAVLLMYGDPAGAAAAADRDDRGAADYAALLRLPVRHAIRGAVLFESGDWDSAMAEIEAANALTVELGVSLLSSYASAVSALIHTHRGDLAAATAALSAKVGGAGSEWVGLAHATLAEANGDLAGATMIAQLTFDLTLGVGMVAMAAQIAPRLARLLVSTGGETAGLRDRLLAITFDCPVPAADARVAWAMAMLDGDHHAIGAAAEQLSSRGMAVDAALAWQDAARLSGVMVDQRALDTLARLDIAVATAAGAAPRRRRNEATFGWESITESEQKVLDLLADGLDNASIAERLYLSRRTVESHLSHVYTKLQVSGRSRLVAAALARRHGH